MTLNRPLHLILMLLLAIAVAGCSSTGDEKGRWLLRTTVPTRIRRPTWTRCPTRCRASSLRQRREPAYVVFGQRYVPDTTGQPYRKQGIASWYGKKFHGNSTSIGEPYDMYAMTAAHTLPVPSYAG